MERQGEGRSKRRRVEKLKKKLETAEMVRMRAMGATIAQIAERYGISAPAVSKRLRRYIESVQLESVSTLRAIELETLNQIQRSIFPDVLRGDLKAVDRLLRIIDLRAKLMGLYAPQEIQATVRDEWRERLQEIVQDKEVREAVSKLTLKVIEGGKS